MDIITSETFDKWFRKLRNKKAIRIIKAHIARMRDGHLGDHKYLSHEIYELRIHLKPGYRLYYAKEEDVLILLLSGGTKDKQPRDIKKAIELLKEWRDTNA